VRVCKVFYWKQEYRESEVHAEDELGSSRS
jgi:hypothetical protein